MCENNYIEIYEGTEIYIKGNVLPKDASQDIAVKGQGENKEDVSTENTSIDTGAVLHNVVKTTFANVGEYTIKVYALADENINLIVTVNVKEAPSLETLISNRYILKSESGAVAVDVNFTPSVDLKHGVVSIFDLYEPKDSRNMTYNYEYNETTKSFILTNTDDSTTEVKAKLEFSASYNLTYVRPSSGVYVQLIVYSPIVLVAGEWTGMITSEGNIRHMITLYFMNDGSGYFAYDAIDGFSSSEHYDVDINATGVENEDGSINISLSENSLNSIYGYSKITSVSNIVKSGTKISLSITFDGVDYNVDLTKGG